MLHLTRMKVSLLIKYVYKKSSITISINIESYWLLTQCPVPTCAASIIYLCILTPALELQLCLEVTNCMCFTAGAVGNQETFPATMHLIILEQWRDPDLCCLWQPGSAHYWSTHCKNTLSITQNSRYLVFFLRKEKLHGSLFLVCFCRYTFSSFRGK